jgi:hypothetical protein
MTGRFEGAVCRVCWSIITVDEDTFNVGLCDCCYADENE